MKSIVCVFIISLSFCNAKELPSFVQKCKRGDQIELNKCLIDRGKSLIPRLLGGIPEMKLPPIEPLHVPTLDLKTGNREAVEFEALLGDLAIYGGQNVQVKEIDFDLENRQIFLHIFFSNLRIKGHYEFNGKILLLQLKSEGALDMNITDIDSSTHTNISIVTRNDKHYIKLGNNYGITRKYGTVSLYFSDLFRNNPQLTEDTNKVINENIQEIEKEMGPLLEDSFHSLTVEMLQPFYDEFSIEELFD